MLKITVELIPRGDESKKRWLGTLTIINELTGTLKLGNYIYFLSDDSATIEEGATTGLIDSFPRQKLTFWDLIYRILRDRVGDRNQK